MRRNEVNALRRTKKTFEQIAREEDEKVARGREAEGYVRVEAQTADEVGHYMMIRFSADELATIEKKAEAKGMPVRDYVREKLLGSSRASQKTSKSA